MNDVVYINHRQHQTREGTLKIFRRIGLWILFYPFVLIFIFGLFHLFDFSRISSAGVLSVIAHERVKLDIDPNIEIRLILTDKEIFQTSWTKAEGPFTIEIHKNTIFQRTIRHEMFHIKRILKLKIDGKDTLGIRGFVRYIYIEEPLACVYGFFGINIFG